MPIIVSTFQFSYDNNRELTVLDKMTNWKLLVNVCKILELRRMNLHIIYNIIIIFDKHRENHVPVNSMISKLTLSS